MNLTNEEKNHALIALCDRRHYLKRLDRELPESGRYSILIKEIDDLIKKIRETKTIEQC